MVRRIPVVVILGVLLIFTAACTNKKVNNPLANVGSKQPDKVLFDRAMDAMKHNRFDVARMTLQTLINTYPDSEYVARAKLAIGDSWYAEGGSASLAQAEIEYKDFQTFFPNMPEAAEAQLKIANIHYQQMEKPDRDYTHAMRAEEEYRNLILQYPDSKLVPEAKQRLMEVQEVLAEREFEIGRFYYMRQSYPAAIARLQSVADKYPLYSGADEVLFLLGQSYEGEIALIRGRQIAEQPKARAIAELTKKASEAYSKIITRYPLAERAEDAKLRLEDLKQPVPKPTKEAIAQNKAEIDSRHSDSMMKSMLHGFQKHPSVAQATHVGNPTLTDPAPMSATDVAKETMQALMGKSAAGDNKVAVDVVKDGAPPPNEPVPHSGDTSAAATDSGNGTPAAAPAADPKELQPTAQPDSAQPDSNQADSKELKVNADDNSQTLPPPAQVNEIPNAGDTAQQKTAASSNSTDTSDVSSSKKKKKKGLHKIVPF